MVDYQIYSKFHGAAEAFSFSTKDRAAFDPWPETLSSNVSLSKPHLLLLPPGIHGFYLKEKKWSGFFPLLGQSAPASICKGSIDFFFF